MKTKNLDTTTKNYRLAKSFCEHFADKFDSAGSENRVLVSHAELADWAVTCGWLAPYDEDDDHSRHGFMQRKTGILTKLRNYMERVDHMTAKQSGIRVFNLKPKFKNTLDWYIELPKAWAKRSRDGVSRFNKGLKNRSKRFAKAMRNLCNNPTLSLEEKFTAMGCRLYGDTMRTVAETMAENSANLFEATSRIVAPYQKQLDSPDDDKDDDDEGEGSSVRQ